MPRIAVSHDEFGHRDAPPSHVPAGVVIRGEVNGGAVHTHPVLDVRTAPQFSRNIKSALDWGTRIGQEYQAHAFSGWEEDQALVCLSGLNGLTGTNDLLQKAHSVNLTIHRQGGVIHQFDEKHVRYLKNRCTDSGFKSGPAT